MAQSDINAEGLAKTRQAVKSSSVWVSLAVVDVANRKQIQSWEGRAAEEHYQVNLVINNTGVAHAGYVEGSSYEEYVWITNINLWGGYDTKAFQPHTKAFGHGHIVNISSIFSTFSLPGMSAYNATKLVESYP